MSNAEKKIDKKNIKAFFKERAKKHDKKNPLKSVIYQDKNPKLAKDRDKYEKNKITKLININQDDIVLDIGCGIGRWAERVSKVAKKYVGIDYISDFIDIAKVKHKKNANTYFVCLDGVKFINSKIKFHSPYTVFIVMGLYPYINDKEGYNVLKNILKICANKSKIIIREPIATKKQIALNNIWSDDMETHYTATYRTHDWFKKMFDDILFKEGFSLIIDEALYPKHLNNRKETKQHLFCLEKIVTK